MNMKTARARRLTVGWFGMMALAACLVACGNPESASPTQSTPFTGTLAVGTAAYFAPFTVSKEGTVTITATALSPQTGAAIGLGLGEYIDSSCVIEFEEPGFYVGQPISFDNVTAGQYCGEIYDIGYLTQDNTFTVTVAYP